MRKIALIGGGAVALIAVIAIGLAVFLYSSLDGLVKRVVEHVGSQVAGVPVTVSDVKIELREGRATLRGLTVANPKGFTADKLFHLKEITVTIDPGSVTGNPVVVKDISVASPEVTVEMGGQGTNLQALQKNMAGASSASSSGSGSASGGGDSSGGKKLVIDRLALTGGTVNLATPIPGAKASGRLGDITLTGIGRKSGGATATEVAEQVLSALIAASAKAAQGLGVGGVVDGVAGQADKLVPGASETLKGLLGK